MLGKATTHRIVWSMERITAIRAEIKSAILELGRSESPEDVSKWILQQLSRAADSTMEDAVLRSYVLIMSALIHHVRHGCLSQSQVNRLFQDGQDLLRVAGITCDHPRLSFLHAELHLAMSQIEMRRGNTWSSLWIQQVARGIGRGSSLRDEGARLMSQAIRLNRYGLGEMSREFFHQVEEKHTNPREVLKARLHQLKIARLCRDWQTFSDIRRQFDASEIDPFFRQELEWEEILAQAVKDGAWERVRNAIQKSGSHYEASYVADGRMLLLGNRHMRYHDNLSRITTINSDKQLKINRIGEMYKALTVMENAYDSEIDLDQRFQNVGGVAPRLHLLRSFEQEMLCLVTLVRWLSRNNQMDLARVCLTDYEYRSLRFSGGRIRDLIGCAEDLLSRAWYRHAEESEDSKKLVS